MIEAHLRAQTAPFVPEFRLYLADELVPLWQATEALVASGEASDTGAGVLFASGEASASDNGGGARVAGAATGAPPFWAFAWPGSLALARYLLDTPGCVAGQRVLDFGSGGGLAAIAAAACGASHVLACDLDPLAAYVQGLNASLNQVTFERRCDDLVDRDLVELGVSVVLAGDVCYEREPSARILAWLRRQAGRGVRVLLADPGRTYAPSDGLDLLATYDVPTLPDLESVTYKPTRLWRLQQGTARCAT